MTIDKRFVLIDHQGEKRYPYKKAQKSTGRYGFALTAEGERDRNGGGTYVDDIETVITKMVHEGWSVRAKAIDGPGNTVGILKTAGGIVGYEIDSSLLHLVKNAKLAPMRVVGTENSKEHKALVQKSGVESTEVEYPADEKLYKEIKTRRGQAQFRNALMLAYREKCFVSDSAVASVLEAAHIVPHSNDGSYSVNNGVLLRADIHTLYDLNLLGIDRNGTIHVHPKIAGSEYEQYDQKTTLLSISEELSRNLSLRFETGFLRNIKKAPSETHSL